MWMRRHVHLAFEVLHDVQEDIVNIRTVMELNFDSIEVAKCVRDIELTIGSCVQILRHGLGSCLDVILLLCRGRLGRGYDGRGCRNARIVCEWVQ
jgi:hypothetical protein